MPDPTEAAFQSVILKKPIKESLYLTTFINDTKNKSNFFCIAFIGRKAKTKFPQVVYGLLYLMGWRKLVKSTSEALCWFPPQSARNAWHNTWKQTIVRTWACLSNCRFHVVFALRAILHFTCICEDNHGVQWHTLGHSKTVCRVLCTHRSNTSSLDHLLMVEIKLKPSLSLNTNGWYY